MTRFRDLLTYDPASTPGDEQRRASEGLADAVARSRLRWWKGRKVAPLRGKCILLVVAPFSQYDLTLLDLLDERLDTDQPPVPVYVANLQDQATAEQLSADFPGIGAAPQTPIVAICDSGSLQTVACGKRARDVVAQALGLPADELSRRIVAESPSYVNSAAQRVASPHPPKAAKGERMTDEHRRFLWQSYREQQSQAGPARERLPYTGAFTNILTKLKARFGTTFDEQEVWSVLSDLDRHPERRRQIGIEDDTPGAVQVDPDRLPPLPPVAAADVASQVERWLAHLGPGSRSFWRLAAEFSRGRASFTFEDLSRHCGIPKATLRSYHRNSYRAIRHEEAPDPLPGLWDAQIRANVYWMADPVREKILELTQNDPR